MYLFLYCESTLKISIDILLPNTDILKNAEKGNGTAKNSPDRAKFMRSDGQLKGEYTCCIRFGRCGYSSRINLIRVET
jgi:hypothetical protein